MTMALTSVTQVPLSLSARLEQMLLAFTRCTIFPKPQPIDVYSMTNRWSGRKVSVALGINRLFYITFAKTEYITTRFLSQNLVSIVNPTTVFGKPTFHLKF